MTNQSVKIFENEKFGQIRTAGTSEEPLFCLSDICRVLELQVQNTKQRLKEDGVYSIKVGNSCITSSISKSNMKKLKHIKEVNIKPLSTWTRKETTRFKIEHIKAVNNIIDYYSKK